MNSLDEQAAPQRSSRLPGLLLVLILSLSALIQFNAVARTEVDFPLRSDAGDYFTYAYNLHHHGVYSRTHPSGEGVAASIPVPDKVRSPGYPLFLAMVGAPEPTDAYLRRVSLIQAGLGVLSVWLIYLVAVRFVGRNWALPVALLTALSPHLATISTYLLTESLFFFLLLASIYSLLRAVDSQGRWLYVLTGVLWGLTTLVRPTAELFPPVLLVAVLALPQLRKFRLSALLAFACFAAVLAPWVIRNQSDSVNKSGPDLMVLTLLHGSYPDFMYEGRAQSFGFPYRFDPDSERISRDLPTVLKHIADRFRAQPATYTRWYLFGKPGYFLSWGNVQGWDVFIYPVKHSPYFENRGFAAIRFFSLTLHWPLMVLGLAGAVLVWLRPRSLMLDDRATRAATIVALVVAYAIAFHIIVAPFPRYGIPFRPLLFALAVVAARAMSLHLLRHLRERKTAKVT
jgi:4-amino-4-deoxy-L-arabinose transferase-like glycosyltransferase